MTVKRFVNTLILINVRFLPFDLLDGILENFILILSPKEVFSFSSFRT